MDLENNEMFINFSDSEDEPEDEESKQI